MAGGINIPFLANVRDFLRGTGDVEDALDDVSDSLDDMSREAQDAGRDAARSLGDVGEDGADAAQQLERSFRDSLDAVRAESASTGDAVGRSMDDGAQEAGEGLATIQEEAAGTATEVAASFDGSMESIAGGFQELSANALSGFGPAGAVAGVAVAAGMGIAMAGMEAAKEEAQATAEAVGEIAGEMIDLGSTTIGAEHVRDALKSAATEAEDGSTKMQEWADTAEDAGIDFGRFAAGMAGDADAAQLSLTELNDKIAAETDAIAALRAEAAQGGLGRDEQQRLGAAIVAHGNYAVSLEATRDQLSTASGVVDTASDTFDLYTEAVDASAVANLSAEEATIAATEAIGRQATAALEASNAAIGYAASVEDATTTIAENGATLDLTTEAGRNNQSALNDLAASTLDLADATMVNGVATDDTNVKLAAGRDAFVNAAIAAGSTKDAAEALATSYGLVPRTLNTNVTSTGVDAAILDMDRIPKSMTISVGPTIDLASWQRAVDSTAAGIRKPVIEMKSLGGGPTF